MPTPPVSNATAKVLSNKVTKLEQKKALNIVHTSTHPLRRKEVVIFQKFPARKKQHFEV